MSQQGDTTTTSKVTPAAGEAAIASGGHIADGPASATTTTTTNATKPGKSGNKASKETTNGTSSSQTEKPSVIEQVKRIIPGLKSKDDNTKAANANTGGSKRNRGRKAGAANTTGSAVANADDPALATANLESAPSREELPESLQARTRNGEGLTIATGKDEEQQLQPELKRFSAAAIITKRLRTHNKKLVGLFAFL